MSITQKAGAETGQRVSTVMIELDDITLVSRYYPVVSGKPAPAVLLLHGWGWPDVDPGKYMHDAAEEFQREGFAVLVPTMRGWPPTGGSDDCAGRQVDDAKHALAWLASQKTVDPSRLYIAGFSQGGQVALLASARNAPVRATAAFAPVVDPGSWGRETNVDGIRDYVMEECGGPEGWPSRSLLVNTRVMPVPLLLVHGDADLRVPVSQSTELYKRIHRGDTEVELTLLPGLTHDPGTVLRPQLAIAFFRRHDHVR